jgi:hypothetical protein
MDGARTSMEPLEGGLSGETFLATAGDERELAAPYAEPGRA